MAQIAESIREIGCIHPILTSPEGARMAGHGRVLALTALGPTPVPVWASAVQRRGKYASSVNTVYEKDQQKSK
jgi:hypothetical protein